MAVSAKTGTVFAWGYGSFGRLGFGEEEATNKSEQEPREIPYFEHSIEAKEEEDILEEMAPEQDEDDEVDLLL